MGTAAGLRVTGVRFQTRSAGFQACCIAGFQTGRPREFVGANKLRTGDVGQASRLPVTGASRPGWVRGECWERGLEGGVETVCAGCFQFGRVHKFVRPAGLETGDTAGLETCATTTDAGAGRLPYLPDVFAFAHQFPPCPASPVFLGSMAFLSSSPTRSRRMTREALMRMASPGRAKFLTACEAFSTS